MTRALVKLHRGKGKHLFFSKKNQVLLRLESYLERDYALRLEFDDDVISYCCQPETCHTDRGQRTPDFLVKRSNERFEYIEVHLASRVDDEYRARMKYFNDYIYAKSRRTFLLVTDEDMNKVASKNLDFLYEYKSLGFSYELSNLPEELSLAMLIHYFEESSMSRNNAHAAALSTIADAIYAFDMKEILSHSTLLKRN
ncbi:hypothetical protein [Shewanella acanthi]|uniref:hypothetical protein n=1 Tax=Shewanella acanthi TaxID=2864212 RepID=UPI001C6569D7|nr:hypothetical protein [Shewanella acanthi]QYJ80481.1 hypothetical protein K0H61_09015 [Shewanella acanthi]